MSRRGAWSRWMWLLAVLVAIGANACTVGESLEPPTVRPWNVLGVVTTTEFGDDYEVMAVQPGPAASHPRMRMGPMTLTLADGREFTVPADTPGDNHCRQLRPHLQGPDVDPSRVPAHFSVKCVILGSEVGDVLEWFIVLDFDPQLGVDFGHPFPHADGLLTSSGFVFPVADQVTISCHSSIDTIDGVLHRNGPASTYVDPSTAEIVSVHCLGVE